ncbi:MAG: ATP-binding protein [Candidatus Aminicenantes bacterium]|nr:ATP-binding protein [Candidatus Aminicenantes bacterium]
MKRDIYRELLDWKQSKLRKPLILRGARQVGKTYILKEFAKKEYENFVYLNFEDDPTLDALFVQRFDKQKILSYLSTYGGAKLSPGSSLIIFDEIQAADSALNSLKYFREKAPEYHVAAAGSLLGIKLKSQKSFPVGQVNFLDLYPLTFLEFLDALKKTALRNLIEAKQEDFTPFPEPFHVELIELLKSYYLTGGMPEAVSTFRETNSFSETRRTQEEIIDSYLLDFSKHAEKNDVMKISELWRSIPLHLSKENKKFIFSAVKKSARARDYERALQWLLDAGIIYKSYNISQAKLPLALYAGTNIFKVFLLDVGLLGAMANLSPGVVISGDAIFFHFHGALVENYVAQQLKNKFRGDLFYWTSAGKAEVDFVFAVEGGVFPLEAKAGVSLKSKSLKVYKEKYRPAILSRTSLLNLKKDGITCNYPLYAISLFPVS